MACALVLMAAQYAGAQNSESEKGKGKGLRLA